MSFPVTITPSSGLSVQGSRGNSIFEHSGNLYFLGEDNVSGNHFHAWKSTDGGNTWTAQDDSNSPVYDFTPPINQSFGGCYTTAVDGNALMVLWVDATHDPSSICNSAPFTPPNFPITQLWICSFNLSTDTWGTRSSLSNPGVDFMNFTGTDDCSTRAMVQLLVRGAGDYILYYSGTESGSGASSAARVSYSTFDGSTFGSEVQLPSQSTGVNFPIGAACDGGVTYFLYLHGELPIGAFTQVFHVSMDSGGTFGTTQDVLSLAGETKPYFGGAVANDYISTPIVAAGKIYFALPVAVSGDETTKLFWAATATDPTWNVSPITTDPNQPPEVAQFTFTAHGPFITVASNGTNIAVSWNTYDFDNDFGQVYYSTSPVGSLSWTTPALLWQYAWISGNITKAMEITSLTFASGMFGVLGIGITQGSLKFVTQFYAFQLGVTLGNLFHGPQSQAAGNAWQ